MTNTTIEKIIVYASGIIPWCLIISIVSFYMYTSIILKRFPFYRSFVEWLDSAWGFSIALWLICLIVFSYHGKLQEYKRILLIGTLGHIVMLGILFSSIGEWYLD